MSNLHEMTLALRPGSLQRVNRWFSSIRYKAMLLVARASVLALSPLIPSCFAEESASACAPPEASVNNTLPVNWIYGAYIPKDAPIAPLTGEERFKLYLWQTYTTPGI
jgi:hypothetical protein